VPKFWNLLVTPHRDNKKVLNRPVTFNWPSVTTMKNSTNYRPVTIASGGVLPNIHAVLYKEERD
jgi:hypothetical protein